LFTASRVVTCFGKEIAELDHILGANEDAKNLTKGLMLSPGISKQEDVFDQVLLCELIDDRNQVPLRTWRVD
jgi:hypothetical protein